jgi:hypothetical protein
VTETSGKQSQTETPNSEAQLGTEPSPPGKRSSRAVSFLAPVVALAGLAAVVVNGPAKFDISLPDLSSLAELLPHETAPKPDSAISVALKDIQSAQQQYVAALQENGDVLQQNTSLLNQNTGLLQHNTGLLHQNAANLESMKQGFASEQTTLNTISNQLTSLIARVDALQNATAPLTTSSIPQPSARARSTRIAHRKISRLRKPAGPVSVDGMPLISAPIWGPPFGG